MIGKKVLKAFNEQIKHELESGYLYLAMAADFHNKGFDGMAKWMRIQALEEQEHAMKFFDHIVERGGVVELMELSKPQKEWASPLEAFEAAYEHEKFITAKIDSLVKLAREEDDNAAGVFLQWFVTEQVEEESNASTIVDLLKKVGKAGQGVIMLDMKLGERSGD